MPRPKKCVVKLTEEQRSYLQDLLKKEEAKARKRLAEKGLEAVLRERPHPAAEPKLDAKEEAILIALTCSDPLEGREHWTMQLLADKLTGVG